MNELQPVPHAPLSQAIGPAGILNLTQRPGSEIPGIGLKRDYAGILEYWQMVRRRKGALIVATCIGGAIGFLMTLSAPRVYQSRITMEIQGLNDEFLNMRNVNPTAQSSGGSDVDLQTHVKILQSKLVLDRVRGKLQAGKRPDDLQPPDRLGMWRKAVGINPPTQDALWRQAVGTAAGSVRVRSSGMNRIVDATCDSTNPQVASDFCNALASEYIEQNLEARWTATEHTGEWLTKQLQDLKIKLEKSEEELQSYARKTGLVFTGEKTDAQEAILTDLQKEVSAAQADRITKQSRYELAVASPPAALPELVDDVSLKAAQAVLGELKGKLAQLRVTFTPNHTEVRRVEAQIVAMETSLQGSSSNIMTRIRNEYESARRREALLTAAYSGQAGAMSGKAEETAHYTLLRREVDASRTLYESLLQKLKEASISSALRANNIRVVDAAERPSAPYKPDVTQQVTLGFFGGMILGVALIVLREQADRTLQDPGDSAYYLGLSELGVVPVGSLLVQPGLTTSRSKSVGALRSGGPLLAEPSDDRVEMISWQQKNSLLAESYRTTLTSILFSRQNGDRPRVLVFTSASPKEGKTTTVCNLGISLAEINQRVLLIDSDMRRPRLHSVFNVGNQRGLSDLLLEKNPLNAEALEASCVQTSVTGLYLLPSGGSRRSASSLLHSARLPELLSLAREKFDTVVIDTPPMVNIADARVVARFGDALILIVRSGQTTRDAALLAKSRFAEDGTPILGAILNFWNPKTPGYGYYRYYYAGYHHYYGGGDNDGDGNDNASKDTASTGTGPKQRYARPQLGDGGRKERAS